MGGLLSARTVGGTREGISERTRSVRASREARALARERVSRYAAHRNGRGGRFQGEALASAPYAREEGLLLGQLLWRERGVWRGDACLLHVRIDAEHLTRQVVIAHADAVIPEKERHTRERAVERGVAGDRLPHVRVERLLCGVARGADADLAVFGVAHEQAARERQLQCLQKLEQSHGRMRLLARRNAGAPRGRSGLGVSL